MPLEKDWKPTHRGFEVEPKKEPKAERKPVDLGIAEEDLYDDTKPSRKHATTTSGEPVRVKGKTLLWAGLAILLILILILVIIPGMRGYAVYKAMKASGVPDEYLTNMQGMEQAKAAAEAQAAAAQQQASQAQTERDAAVADAREQQQAAEQEAEKQKARADEYDKVAAEFKQESESKDAALADAGRRLCCAKRVDDASINSYDIQDNKIVCGTDLPNDVSC